MSLPIDASAILPLPVLLPLLGSGAALMLARWPRAQRTVSIVVLLGIVVVFGAAEIVGLITGGA